VALAAWSSPTATSVDAIAVLSAAVDARTQTILGDGRPDGGPKPVDSTTRTLDSRSQALQGQVTKRQMRTKKILKKLKKLGSR
jgi:hypothetical protein